MSSSLVNSKSFLCLVEVSCNRKLISHNFSIYNIYEVIIGFGVKLHTKYIHFSKMKLGLILSYLFYFVLLMLMQYKGCNGCLEKERIALLEIKHYFLSQKGDPDNKLGSWIDDRDSNCCSWNRVKCYNISSGHITELSLSWLLDWTLDPNDPTMLNVSLFRPFEELRLLDLSKNDILRWIGDEGTPLILIYKTSLTKFIQIKKVS